MTAVVGSRVGAERTAEPPRAVGGRRDFWFDVGALAVVASVLRFWRLDTQLWADEVAAVIHRFRLPPSEIVLDQPGVAPHVLYDLMAGASIRAFGEHAWSARLPAAIFGVAGVVALYVLGRRLGGRVEGLLAAGLMAVSYHHVFFSQNARGYPVMIFWFVVATALLVAARDSVTPRTGAGYVGAAVLASYSVPFGVAILPAHALAAIPAAWTSRRDLARRLFVVFAAGGAVLLVVYLPLISHLVDVAATEGQSAGSGAKLGFGLLTEALGGVRQALPGPALAAGGLVWIVGAVAYLRRDPRVFALLAGPALLTAVILVALRTGVHPRYLLVSMPLVFLVAARGLVTVWGPVGRRVPAAVGVLALLAMVAVSATPLARYYAAPKQDFLGALAVVDREAAEGDAVVAVGAAGNVIDAYYRPGFPTIDDLDGLLALEAASDRVWVITSMERIVHAHASDLLDRLREDYELIRVLPGTQEDAAMRIYVGGRRS